jgi:hypothetical protein
LFEVLHGVAVKAATPLQEAGKAHASGRGFCRLLVHFKDTNAFQDMP